jgi:WW domain
MEEESEVLDWGNEDDEQLHLESHRKASYAEFDYKNGVGDVSDAEDAVSLGEDEEEQDYLTYQQQEHNADTESKDKHTLLSKSANKGDFQQHHQSESSQELQRSTSHNPSSAPGSPHRNQSSSDQPHPSPQRSHSFTTRLTHALPPKPVVANVPYLHPSHPSIVEATAMSTRRSESLKNKSNGPSSTTASTTGTKSNGADAPLPAGWEARNPRSGGLKVYYYNSQTQQSTWDRPVSSSNATPSLKESRGRSTRRRRERSHSAGGRPSSPSKSDQPTPQEHSRSSRAQPNVQGDSDITDPQQPSLQSSELSFEDRHYRPQETHDNVGTADNRQGDRHDDPAFTPPASPHRSREHTHGRDRERGKSLSPVRSAAPAPSRGRDSRSSRGSRGSRGGHHGPAITDADSSMQRDRDHSVADFASPRNVWDHAPSNLPVDLNSSNSHQGARRQQRQPLPHSSNFDPPFESSAFEDRPPLSRNGSTRGRNRGRESRAIEGREQQNRSQNLSTTSSTLSASYHPPSLHLSYPCMATVASALRESCFPGLKCKVWLRLRAVCRYSRTHYIFPPLSCRLQDARSSWTPSSFLFSTHVNSVPPCLILLLPFSLNYIGTRSTPPHLHDREPDTLQREPDQPPPTPSVSTSAPMLEAMPAHPQRKRDRPSRFDRPATMVMPAVGTAHGPAQILTPVEQIIVRPREDDVYIPDDILQASRERIRHIVRDELTPSTSQQVVHSGNANGPSYHDKRSWDQGQPSAEQGRTSPVSEHQASRTYSPTSPFAFHRRAVFSYLHPSPALRLDLRCIGRKRAPLPPQDIRFHEAVSRPQQAPPNVDSAAPYQHYRPPPPQLSPSQPTMAPPQGPRDHHHRPANMNSNSLPSGPRYPPQSQPRGETDIQRMMPPSSGIDRDSNGRRNNDRRSSSTAYAQSLPQSEVVMDVDVNDHSSASSRIPPSPSRNSEAQAGLRAGAGMYADREGGVSDVLPRGPRAMATKPPVHMPDGGFPPPQSASLSPTTPYVYGHNADGRSRDHSPPPQQTGYMNERGVAYDNSRHEGASGWRDERHNHGYSVQDRGHGQV